LKDDEISRANVNPRASLPHSLARRNVTMPSYFGDIAKTAKGTRPRAATPGASLRARDRARLNRNLTRLVSRARFFDPFRFAPAVFADPIPPARPRLQT
jgi:hypothetical protein